MKHETYSYIEELFKNNELQFNEIDYYILGYLTTIEIVQPVADAANLNQSFLEIYDTYKDVQSMYLEEIMTKQDKYDIYSQKILDSLVKLPNAIIQKICEQAKDNYNTIEETLKNQVYANYQGIEANIPKYTNLSKIDYYYIGYLHSKFPMATIDDLFILIGDINKLYAKKIISKEKKRELVIALETNKLPKKYGEYYKNSEQPRNNPDIKAVPASFSTVTRLEQATKVMNSANSGSGDSKVIISSTPVQASNSRNTNTPESLFKNIGGITNINALKMHDLANVNSANNLKVMSVNVNVDIEGPTLVDNGIIGDMEYSKTNSNSSQKSLNNKPENKINDEVEISSVPKGQSRRFALISDTIMHEETPIKDQKSNIETLLKSQTSIQGKLEIEEKLLIESNSKAYNNNNPNQSHAMNPALTLSDAGTNKMEEEDGDQAKNENDSETSTVKDGTESLDSDDEDSSNIRDKAINKGDYNNYALVEPTTNQPNSKKKNFIQRQATLLIEDIETKDNTNNNNNANKKVKRINSFEEEALSLALIQQLQKEEENIIQEKIKNQEEKYKDINCSICLDSLYDMDFMPLEKCGHIYHIECMSGFFKTRIDEKKFPLKCPIPECGKEIISSDLKEVLDQEYQDKFIDFTLNNFIELHNGELRYCPTPDCKYAFAFDDKEVQFKCPTCQKEYCVKCNVPWHDKQTCAEYKIANSKDEGDQLFEKFAKDQKFRQCPKCKVWVQKEVGCKAIVCKCGTQFCYECGSEGDGHLCRCNGGNMMFTNLNFPARALPVARRRVVVKRRKPAPEPRNIQTRNKANERRGDDRNLSRSRSRSQEKPNTRKRRGRR